MSDNFNSLNNNNYESIENNNVNSVKPQSTSQRSHIVTLLLAWFLGWLGIHRFYTGYIFIGIIQLITLGGFGLWQLIDVIAIAFGKYRDADGRDLADYNAGCGMIVFIIILAGFIMGGLSSALGILGSMH